MFSQKENYLILTVHVKVIIRTHNCAAISMETWPEPTKPGLKNKFGNQVFDAHIRLQF